MRVLDRFGEASDDCATGILVRKDTPPMIGRLCQNASGHSFNYFRGVTLVVVELSVEPDQATKHIPKPLLDRCCRKIAAVRRTIDLIPWRAASHKFSAGPRPLTGCESICQPPIGQDEQTVGHRNIESGCPGQWSGGASERVECSPPPDSCPQRCRQSALAACSARRPCPKRVTRVPLAPNNSDHDQPCRGVDRIGQSR